MGNTFEIDKKLLQNWLINNLSYEAVESELVNLGVPKEYIDEYVSAYKKLKNEKRQNTAFLFLAGGAFLGFLSFLIAITDLLPEFHTINLYGGTTLAGIIIFTGLYFLFE